MMGSSMHAKDGKWKKVTKAQRAAGGADDGVSHHFIHDHDVLLLFTNNNNTAVNLLSAAR